MSLSARVKLRKTLALILISMLALIGLAAAGATSFAAIVYGCIPFGADFLSSAFSLPSNPVRLFAAFDMLTIAVLMMPWAALSAWVYWSLEGTWLDHLDPRGRARDAAIKWSA